MLIQQVQSASKVIVNGSEIHIRRGLKKVQKTCVVSDHFCKK